MLRHVSVCVLENMLDNIKIEVKILCVYVSQCMSVFDASFWFKQITRKKGRGKETHWDQMMKSYH